jgi:hypothetical protein
MLYSSGIVAAITVTLVIWFSIVVMALGSALSPLLVGVRLRLATLSAAETISRSRN